MADPKALAAAGVPAREELMGLEGGCISLEAASVAYSRPTSSLADHLETGQLIGIRDHDGRVQLPVWQFGASGMPLPGLSDVLAKLRRSPGYSEVTPLRFFLCPNPRTGGDPIVALRRGELSAVLEAADAEAD